MNRYYYIKKDLLLVKIKFDIYKFGRDKPI